MAYYQLTGVGAVSIIGSLLLLLPIQGTYSNFIDQPIVHEVDASLGPLEINDHYSLEEKAGDAQLPFNFLSVYENFIDTERDCEFCVRVEYIPGPEGVAGMAFKNDKGLDLSTAKKLTFYVMGLGGGEVVKFYAAGKKVDSTEDSIKGLFKNVNFDKTTQDVTLSKNWKKIEIDLSNSDLRGITHPFGFEMSKEKNGPDSVIYLKGVRYEFDQATTP